MVLSCPRCEQEPAPDATAGSRCTGCGAQLVIEFGTESPGPALELDRVAATAAVPRRRAPRSVAGVVVVLLIAAFLAVGIVVLVGRDHPRSPSNLPGVSIYIRAVGTFEVTIDGRVAGKTPLVYTSPKTTKPILIEVRQLGFVQQVVPDRDQDVFAGGP
jgi:hypothetical protein